MMESEAQTIRHRGKKEDSDVPCSNQITEGTSQQGIFPSKDNRKRTRSEPRPPLDDDDYEDKEPPIQFAIFLIVLAAFFAIVTLCVNHARTSGWFDDLGKT